MVTGNTALFTLWQITRREDLKFQVLVAIATFFKDNKTITRKHESLGLIKSFDFIISGSVDAHRIFPLIYTIYYVETSFLTRKKSLMHTLPKTLIISPRKIEVSAVIGQGKIICIIIVP